MDDGPQLRSKFSSDGEDSFIGRPEVSRYPVVSRGTVQKFAGLNNETDAEDGWEPAYRSASLSISCLVWTPFVGA
jgi:hypothetical protein